MIRKRKTKKGSGARQGSAQFYRGRTTQTSNEKRRLKKQKEYRRAKLSKQKRGELAERAKGYARWALAGLLLLVIFSLSQIKSHQYVGLTGLSDADKRVITSLTEDYISGLSKFKTFFDGDDYAAYILDNASFVSRVETSVNPFSTTLKVRVVPKQAIHAFAKSGEESSQDKWIASDGTLISLTADQLAEMGQDAPVTTVVDTTSIEYQEGEQIISVATLDYMQKLTLELHLKDLEVDKYEIGENSREMRLSLAGEKYALIVSLERSIESTVIDLELALQEIAASKKRVTQYVDLRVIDKVFYR